MSYALQAALEARRTYLARACLGLEESYYTEEQADWLQDEGWLDLLDSNGLAHDCGEDGWCLTEAGRELAHNYVTEYVRLRRAS